MICVNMTKSRIIIWGKDYLAHVNVTKPRAKIEQTYGRSLTREAKGLGENHESHLLAQLLQISLSSQQCICGILTAVFVCRSGSSGSSRVAAARENKGPTLEQPRGVLFIGAGESRGALRRAPTSSIVGDHGIVLMDHGSVLRSWERWSAALGWLPCFFFLFFNH